MRAFLSALSKLATLASLLSQADSSVLPWSFYWHFAYCVCSILLWGDSSSNILFIQTGKYASLLSPSSVRFLSLEIKFFFQGLSLHKKRIQTQARISSPLYQEDTGRVVVWDAVIRSRGVKSWKCWALWKDSRWPQRGKDVIPGDLYYQAAPWKSKRAKKDHQILAFIETEYSCHQILMNRGWLFWTRVTLWPTSEGQTSLHTWSHSPVEEHFCNWAPVCGNLSESCKIIIIPWFLWRQHEPTSPRPRVVFRHVVVEGCTWFAQGQKAITTVPLWGA